MKLRTRILFLLAIAVCAFSSCAERQTFAKEDSLASFFDKKEVIIAVVDSGLGGLSVMADAEKRMSESNSFHKVSFVFFNALFSNEGGYNSLDSREEKIRVFDSALSSLEKNHSPDLILIACNTLSVLYEDTAFSKNTKIPVVGIVDSGVDLIAQNLRAYPDSVVILFATQTTVSEESHKNLLMKKGFLEERIISQACPDLVNYIEKGYESDETEMLIFAYVDEALQKVRNHRSRLYVSFNCTHYGYSLNKWKKAFQNLGIKPLAYLNPNSRMIDFLFQPHRKNRFSSTEISARAVSMVKIGDEKISSLEKWLREISPRTADALINYEFDENLFEWKKFIHQPRENK